MKKKALAASLSVLLTLLASTCSPASRVEAVNGSGDSDYTEEAKALLPPRPDFQTPVFNQGQSQGSGQTVVKLRPGRSTYTVNGELKAMDAAPVIVGDRVLLPIRYVVEPFGASVDYSMLEQRVKVVLDSTEVHLWIGKNQALVGGSYVPIDPQNPAVTPIVLAPGRAMVPLRFIAESLDCQVVWDPVRREVTVAYPRSVAT